ncbi:MAG: PulJ/GspJ family protein [Acidimicrobiales bacterium]
MTFPHPHGEEGFSLTELALSFMVMAIVIAMTYMIGAQLVKNSVHGAVGGVAGETAQSQVVQLEQYLRGAITPTNAAIEYPSVSNLCSGAPAGSSTAVQVVDDYQLELCTAPANSTSCTSSNATSQDTACPQLYMIEVDSNTCSTTWGECTLKIIDESVTVNGVNPVVWSTTTLRCDSTCQGDLGTKQNGTPSAVPLLFTYYDSTGTTKTYTPSLVQSIKVDMEELAAPPARATQTQIYTEITDTVWLAGAATPLT